MPATNTWLPQIVARDRKGDRTREQLFQAALAEFRRVGFEQASVGQIASRAGTSRAGFYVHYPCTEAVLLDLQWRLETEMVERLRRRDSLREVLEELIDRLIDIEARLAGGELLRDMLGVYIRRPAGLALADQPFPLVVELERTFAAARGELRAGLDPALATQLFLAALFGLLISPRGPIAERRGELNQLAALFLATPRRAARRG
ncbi:MAG: TetR/AcrR family transcriptional regulator [Candidatus Binatia bacterium]